MKAITVSSALNTMQREQRAEAGGRQRRDDRQRMRQAFVQHAEDDVDREQRRQDHQRLRADREPRQPRVAGGLGADRFRQMQLGHRAVDRGLRLRRA